MHGWYMREIRVEEGLMGGKKRGRVMSIAYLIARYLFQSEGVPHNRVIEISGQSLIARQWS